VPMTELLSDTYTKLRQALIDPQVASLDRRPGDPWKMQPRLIVDGSEASEVAERDKIPKQDTTTCVVADRWGSFVAATPSCNLLTNTPGPNGINTGNRVRGLNTNPEHPNRVEAGKRPRITLTPTLVLKDGLPSIAISVAGGDLQDQTTLNVLLNHIDFGMPPKEAVTSARFHTNHHQDSFDPNPDREAAFVGRGELKLNSAIATETQQELARRGHKVSTVEGAIAHPVMIVIDRSTGVLHAAGDPQAKRHAAAVAE
jgi:gamma-glutamyltranspeptidase/glutathione hydrolase